MSVTMSSPRFRRQTKLSDLVVRAKELAGVPAVIKDERRIDEEFKAREKMEHDRALKLRQEWEKADDLRREEEEQARERWNKFLMMAFLIGMFRQSPQYQPDISF